MSFCSMDDLSRNILTMLSSRMLPEERFALLVFVDGEKRHSCDQMRLWMQQNSRRRAGPDWPNAV
jgi:hypothetical protein